MLSTFSLTKILTIKINYCNKEESLEEIQARGIGLTLKSSYRAKEHVSAHSRTFCNKIHVRGRQGTDLGLTIPWGDKTHQVTGASVH